MSNSLPKQLIEPDTDGVLHDYQNKSIINDTLDWAKGRARQLSIKQASNILQN